MQQKTLIEAHIEAHTAMELQVRDLLNEPSMILNLLQPQQQPKETKTMNIQPEDARWAERLLEQPTLAPLEKDQTIWVTEEDFNSARDRLITWVVEDVNDEVEDTRYLLYSPEPVKDKWAASHREVYTHSQLSALFSRGRVEV